MVIAKKSKIGKSKSTEESSVINQAETSQSKHPGRSISPLDGRYYEKIKNLSEYFSEYGLMKYRFTTEISYAIALGKHGVFKLSSQERESLENIKFGHSAFDKIKDIERRTNHDVKSVELFIKENVKLSNPEIIHFCLTSEDVNSISYALAVRDFIKEEYLPVLKEFLRNLCSLAEQNKRTIMLARTHGQFSIPTTLGKELIVFASRIRKQLKYLEIKGVAKINGAIGNYNAQSVSSQSFDWIKFSREFLKSLDLDCNIITTQIEPHDWLSELFHAVVRVNNILMDFSQDIWRYVSDDYFTQVRVIEEVGSSTMPHKINPIDFENAEGNIGIANASLIHLASKLQVSRLQRDLSDSTALRNAGVAFGHSLLSIKSILNGMKKLEPNKELMLHQVAEHPEVLAEAYQCILRKNGISGAYEKLKDLTRGEKLNLEDMHKFVKSLNVPESVKKQLISLKVEDYIGKAPELVEMELREMRNVLK